MNLRWQLLWQKWCDRFALLQAREQILITLAAVALVLVLCDWLLWSPTGARNQQQQTQITEAKQQLSDLQSQRGIIEQTLAADPDAELRAQLETLHVQVEQENKELGELTVDLIRPDAMATMLRDLLISRKGLKLVTLANVPAVPAFKSKTEDSVDNPEADSNSEHAAAPTIYKHGLTLTFRGNYFEVLDYLRALENLRGPNDVPWHFFWESFDYKVDKYPEAEVTLKVYTLGDKEAWIGA
jgi:MSHA biogenesis protein MshJ